jgi:hypothetical protein
MSEHRVSVLGSGLRRFEDPAESSDPQIRRLVAHLRTVDYAPAPREAFRAELRSQLVAVAPRIIAEGAPATAPTAAAAAGPRRSVGSVLRSIPIARPLGVAASVITVFALLLGGAVWLSQKSLPGDTLYGLKRASENVRLSLTSGDTDRGHEYLSLATTRVKEAQDLTGRTSALGEGVTADSAISSHTAALIKSTLNSADSDVKSGSSLLGDQAVDSDSAKPLDIMKGWAPDQLNRLETLASALPAGSVKSHALSSWNLVKAAQTRAKTLTPRVACNCLKTTKSDYLGPQPTASPSVPTHPAGTSSPTKPNPRATTGRSTSGGTSHPGPSKAPGTTPAKPNPKATSPGLTLPLPSLTIPPLLPTSTKPAKSSKSAQAPIAASSGCLSISIIVSINVGCSSGS